MEYHTNIKHQELVALLGSRNLYLRLVYAHIDNYTKVKGAWCGSRQKLADELEIDRSVVSRKLDELINRGFVAEQNNQYRAVCTTERAENTEMRAENTEMRAESTPPEPPINKINNMEINEKNARAQLRTAQPQNTPSFESLLKAFTLRVGNIKLADSTRDECLRMWSDFPEWKRKMLITKLQNGSWLKPRLDWLISDFNPQPTDYNKKALPDEPVCIAKWNGSWGTYTVREAQEYGMERARNNN